MGSDKKFKGEDTTTPEEFHFFQGLPDNFNRRMAEYLDSDESTTACLLVDTTLNGIVHNDFFPAWQHRLLRDFKIPFEISNTFQSPHIVYRRLKILSRQFYDPEFHLYQKIRYAFSAPGISPFTMPWLFYPFNCDANKDFISQLTDDGPAFQEYYLQMACRVGNLAFVQFLCENYNLKLSSKHLNYACNSGNKHLVKYCTDIHKNSPTIKSMNNAISSGNVELVAYFLNTLQIEPNKTTYSNAVFSGNPMMIQLLINKFGNIEDSSSKLKLSIIYSGDMAWTGELNLPNPMGTQISETINSVLNYKTITLEFIQDLINRYQFIPSSSTLNIALQSGHIDLVIFLITYLNDLQLNLRPNFYLCTTTGDIDFVKQIIKEYQQTPDVKWLRSAIVSGNIELVKYLMREYSLNPQEIDLSFKDVTNKNEVAQFVFCHVPMAQFLIEDCGCEIIQSEFENYIRGNNLPVARYLMTQCQYQWGKHLFPKTFYYTDSITKNVIAWNHAENEARRVDYYEGQMPFISLLAKSCNQDPDNPLGRKVDDDWYLLFKKVFLKSFEFDGYDSTTKEFIPAFSDTPNQKYKFNPKNLTFWTALAIFFGIPSRPEKGGKEGAVWTWRQYIRNFFGGWNPILFDDETDEDNIEGKVLLNLMLIIFPVKIAIALYKLVSIIFKTALNTLKLFTEFLPLLAFKITKNGFRKIITYALIPVHAPRGGFFTSMYYYARAGLAIFGFFSVSPIFYILKVLLRTITSPEKSARIGWDMSNDINGGPTEKNIFGFLIGLGSLITTITFWSYIVAAIWFFAIPLVVAQFPTLVTLFITVSHLPVIAPAFALIQAKITVLWALYSYLTIPLLVAPTALVLTGLSRKSDEFSNDWAQWIPEQKKSEHQSPIPTPKKAVDFENNPTEIQDVVTSNSRKSQADNLVTAVQAASEEAHAAEINANRRSVETETATATGTPLGPNTPDAVSEEQLLRCASAPG